MKIKPTSTDFANWLTCVPQDGDLVFLTEKNRDLLKDTGFPVLAREQVKAQGLSMWSLNQRSWYGYALNQADYCAWLPKGTIESFPAILRNQLLKEQTALNVPTIIENQWMTSFAWSHLSLEEQIQTMRSWTLQNEIPEYESVALSELPNKVQTELARAGYDTWINRFQSFSGPNCFATTAGTFVKDVYTQWLHWPLLEKYLHEYRFKTVFSETPQTGDILVFINDGSPIHAAYFLGEGFYFEKPGQDFYEPYRVALFQNWQSEWPDTQLEVWHQA